MQILKKSDFKTFKTLARMSQTNLHKALYKVLVSMYGENQVTTTNDYTFAIGDIPICLVAHMDTVFPQQPAEIFYDKDANVIWSPQGLGADDRAGVFCILKVLSSGLRPHVIFTTDEEKGCLGAATLAANPCPFPDCRFIVQLDRAHANDCVFYECDNKDFEHFIEEYGFETRWGTMSDISELCPHWGIAGVNLSVGYRDEHSYSEVLFVKHMLNTIEKVKNILQDYDEDATPFFKYQSLWSSYATTCYDCEEIYPHYALIPVIMTNDCDEVLMCGDCIVKNEIKWCKRCGSAVLPDLIDANGFCPYCENVEVEEDEREVRADSNANRRYSKIQPRLYTKYFSDYPVDE